MTTRSGWTRRGALLGLTASALGACATRSPGAQPLEAVLDYARAQKTTGLLIMARGQVITQQNWPLPEGSAGFREAFVHGTARDGALLEDIASQQKSVIALLCAMASDRGLLDADEPVNASLGAGWSRAGVDHESRVTVRHLLEMRSGLTEDLRAASAPGTAFFYNTPAYALLQRVLAYRTGLPLEDLTRTWLTEPLGMTETGWRRRPPALADAGNPTGLVSTPRDVARLGQLVLDGGVGPGGQRVVSAPQLRQLLTPSPTNPAYGRLWWLNGGSHAWLAGSPARRVEGPLIPAAPADLVAALGAHDRKLFVVPSRQLVVVRMGQATPARDFNQQLWLRLAPALPTLLG